jgi:cell shape-determining protein MreC
MKIIKFFYNIFEGACDYLSSPTHDLHVSPTKKLEREIIELKKQLEEAYELKLYSRRKLEQENKMMREEIKSIHDFAKVLIENNISVDITDFIDIKKDTEKVLNKLTKDER